METPHSFGSWGTTSEEILKSRYPLHHACRNGDLEILAQLLFDAQHSVLEEDSFYGWTAAHWAAYFGKLSCLMRLLETGASDVSHASDFSTKHLRQSPAHIAAFAGHSHCLKWLLHCGASLDRQDYLGESALHKAARVGNMECVSLLASHGARLCLKNNNGHTPAQVAEMSQHLPCAHYIEQASRLQGAHNNHQSSFTTSQGGHTAPSPLDVTHMKKVHTFHIDTACGDQHSSMDQEEPMGGLDIGVCADVTLNADVAANTLLVGGRKRMREEDEQPDFKRIRHSAWNGSSNEDEDTKLDGDGGFTFANNNGYYNMQNGYNPKFAHQPSLATVGVPVIPGAEVEMEDDSMDDGVSMLGAQPPPSSSPPSSVLMKSHMPSPVKYSQMLECTMSPHTCSGVKIEDDDTQYPARCIGLTGHFI